MAEKKEKEIKALVEAILSAKKIKYEDWLHQKHIEVIVDNSDTVLAALKQIKGE